MDIFKVTKFDHNDVGEAACKEIFVNLSSNSKRKNKSILKGRVVKKSKKAKNILKNKNEIRNKIQKIVHSNVETNVTIKNKPTSVANKSSFNRKKFPTLELQQKSKKRHSTKTQNIIGKYEVLTNQNSEKNNKLQRKKKRFKEESVSQNENNDIIGYDEKHSSTLDGKQKNMREKSKKKLNKTKCSKQRHNRNKKINSTIAPTEESNILSSEEKCEDTKDYKQRKIEKLKEKLVQTLNVSVSETQKRPKSLREKMMEKLKAARFRYLNEQIYSSDGKQTQKIFNKDPEAFKAYHEGYKQQIDKWPLNPLDVIIKSVQKLPKTHIIADFGCGDAKLAKSVKQKVHSFDFISTNDLVTSCDMAHVPLQSSSVDVVIFCLSLMGTNLQDYILEANRVLKLGGIMKIAEVESRFEDVNQFIEGVRRFRFKNIWKDVSYNLFYFLDFKKEANITSKKKLPTISLQSCLYKKR